jgi:hypothetical protein
MQHGQQQAGFNWLVLLYIAQYSAVVHYPVSYCTSLYCTVLHPTSQCWYCPVLPCTASAVHLGTGPCTTPPFLHWGALLEPWRALPRPFCCHGLRPPPDTSLLQASANSNTTCKQLIAGHQAPLQAERLRKETRCNTYLSHC